MDIVEYGLRDIVEHTLDSVLHKLRPLRIKFRKELRGGISELNDFKVEGLGALYGYTKYAYILGKYVNYENKIPIILISELFVHPKHRGTGIGSQLIRSISQYAKYDVRKLCILGCDRSLMKYYSNLGFVELNSPISTTEYTMMAYGQNCKIEEFEKLLQEK